MANPRTRNSETNYLELSSSLKSFLKKPHAFPLLLSLFLFLTWVFLRLQHSSSSSSSANVRQDTRWSKEDDERANLVRFKSHQIIKDNRGWLLNPVSLALDSAIKGGAVSCASIHVGEIRPGAVRGNHRHHTCNETFVIWGANTLFRLENRQIVDKAYAEVVVSADEIAVAASPSGAAHALVNVDRMHSTYFIGCQDSIINYTSSTTHFNVWKDL